MHYKDGKLVILMDGDGGINDVLSVAGDKGKFLNALSRIEKAWQNTDEEYGSFVYRTLRKEGFHFTALTEFTTYVTAL